MWDWLEAAFGIKMAHLAAGAAGGTVRAFVTKGSWVQAVAAVICGSLAAAYTTSPVFEIATKTLPITPDQPSEYACSYLVGITAMFIAEGVMRMARGWSKAPTFPPRKG